MAQFRRDSEVYLNNGNTIFEVVMLSDKDGNIINTFGAASNIPIANGNVDGHTAVHKFGLVDGTATNPCTIWTGGDTATYTFQTEANTVSANSANTGDNQTITVQGLDASYAEVEEDIVLTGQTETAETTTQFLRMHRAFVKTGNTNAGKISINHNSSGDVISEIAADYGQTLQAFYTVPAGKTAYLSRLRVSSSKQSSAIVVLYVRPFGGAFRAQSTVSLYSGDASTVFDTPLRITEKSDIEVRVKGNTNNTLSADFDMILVDNPA